MIRLNTDALISARLVRTGQGIIARNWTGKIVRTKGIVNQKMGEANKEEAPVVRNALLMAKDAGCTKIEVHTNCKLKVDQIFTSNGYDSNIETVLEDIQDLKQDFEYCNFSFVSRSENEWSHSLAQFAVKLVQNIEWECDFPVWLLDIAKKEIRVVAPFCN